MLFSLGRIRNGKHTASLAIKPDSSTVKKNKIMENQQGRIGVQFTNNRLVCLRDDYPIL